ncbi:MAG: ATP-binding protein [Woeseiaceae bacterium]
MNFKAKFTGKGDRIGLYMVAGSLLVIGVMIWMLFQNQLRADESRIRSEGISLARVLSRVPYDQLVARDGILEVIRQAQHGSDFAYAAIVGLDGLPHGEVTASGVIMPRTVFPDRPDNWLSEREYTLSSGTDVIEVQAPIVRATEVIAYLRLAYHKPRASISADQLPFLATLAFLVFLLTPFFYFLIRREVRPLKQANDRLSDLVENGQISQVDVRATGELGSFMTNFNEFISFANNRIRSLESEHSRLETKTKLLSYRKSRIESVLDAIPEAVIIMDQSGTVSFANQNVVRLLGVSVEDVVEKDPHEWCDDQEVLDVLTKYSSQTSVKQYLAQTVRIAPKKGQNRNLSIKAYPLFSPTDAATIYGTLIVIRDTSSEALAQQNHSEFVSHVAHELKTPLNTIGLNAERLIYDDSQTDTDRIEAANLIQDEVDRMSNLIGNLLNITKIEMGELPIERGHVKLRDFLEDAFRSVTRGIADTERNFELDLPRDFSVVFLDKELLRIAINNLLTNAIKYSGPGGTVTMSADEDDDAVRISVKDSGIGISTEDQQHIFAKFYRSDNDAVRERTGHGLGLSLTHEIVQMHNGHLRVQSELGKGSEFVIELRKESNLLKQAI